MIFCSAPVFVFHAVSAIRRRVFVVVVAGITIIMNVCSSRAASRERALDPPATAVCRACREASSQLAPFMNSTHATGRR